MSEPLMLTGLQKEILMKGVVGAYPDPDNLWILLAMRMEVQVSAMPKARFAHARGDTYEIKVFSLIQDFEAEGRIEEFIRVIVNDKPNSPYLAAIKKEFADILGKDNSYEKINSSPPEETMDNQTRSLAPSQRLELRRTLRALIVSDFNDLIDALQVPKGFIPPPTADAASRVDALWSWADSPTGCGLTTLHDTLEAIAHPQ
jgi:hypothetical protein